MNINNIINFIVADFDTKGILVRSMGVKEITTDVIRNGRTDEDIDKMMRSEKVLLTVLFAFIGAPFCCKIRYRIVSKPDTTTIPWNLM